MESLTEMTAVTAVQHVSLGEEIVFSFKPLKNEKRQVVMVNHEYFAEDAQAVTRDLERLKTLLESEPIH